eukprot:GHUV01000949.1.p1 GENE.GHUV01000949.1~~GHUV01000949.1.p1  ORF type:complete len:485 (+),score=88.15 GHUV01000949.1:638-2092(+)
MSDTSDPCWLPGIAARQPRRSKHQQHAASSHQQHSSSTQRQPALQQYRDVQALLASATDQLHRVDAVPSLDFSAQSMFVQEHLLTMQQAAECERRADIDLQQEQQQQRHQQARERQAQCRARVADSPAAAAHARAVRNEKRRAGADPDAATARRVAARERTRLQMEHNNKPDVILQDVWKVSHAEIAPPDPDTVAIKPVDDSVQHQLEIACQFNKCINDSLPTCICSVCAVYHGSKDMHPDVLASSIQHLALLRCDGPRTPKMPRAALSVVDIDGIRYCLCAEGVTLIAGGGAKLQVCSDCRSSLDRGVVPRASLVYWDIGDVPDGVDNRPDLPKLSIVEELIVAVWRVSRFTVFARPPGSANRPTSTLPRCLHGHIIALPNVPLKSWQKVFSPLHPNDLAEYVSVVILSHAKDREHAERMAKRVQCLKVHPSRIIQWVRHFVPLYERKFPNMEFDRRDAALVAWDAMGDSEVPLAVRDSALFV